MSLVIMIIRACIYLLFPLYLRNLLFPWFLMRMLLTIFLKVPHHVVEVIVVSWCCYLYLKLCRVVLIILVVEVMHSVHLLSVAGGWTTYQIFKKRGLNWISVFRGGREKRGVIFEGVDIPMYTAMGERKKCR